MASQKVYLLLPLCLLSAILLNVYAAVDPTGVYRDYLEKLEPLTPPVAAMATALADGVYPRTGADPSPAPGACAGAGSDSRTGTGPGTGARTAARARPRPHSGAGSPVYPGGRVLF